jgi:hypothetical protein
LVDYHNNLLELVEKELNINDNHTIGVLKTLVKELTSKEVSILQVARYNTGVISLNEKDCSWIEQLSQASLINNEKEDFLNVNSHFMFDFIYVQSQIIRTYLLLCRINYRHIIQKYQCHTKRIQTTNIENCDLDEKYLVPLSNEQLDNEWNYLKDVLLDKLYHAYSLLRQISLTLKTHQDDLSSTNLFEFVRSTDHDIYERLEQYEIKDFQLCHIDHVLKLYTESISDFQHLFTDIPPLLRVPIDSQLNDELTQKLEENLINIEYNNDIDKIQSTIQTITEFLNELKTIEDTLLQQSAQSLREICGHVTINNAILIWLPERIKCENYVALNIHLIRTRSILQERKVNIEEKETKLWNENFNLYEPQTSRFHQYLNPEDETQIINESDDWILLPIDPEELNSNIIHENNSIDVVSHEYLSLIELNLKLVPCTSSPFIEQIHKHREEVQIELIPLNKAQKFTIKHPDGQSVKHLCKTEKFFEQLKKTFDEKKYNLDMFAVVGTDEIFVDFTNTNYRPLHLTSSEYHITEKQFLFQVQFLFRTTIFEYLTTSQCPISAVINRFIDDNQLKSLSSDIYLCFFDEYEKCIDDGIITDLCKTNSRIITIIVTEVATDTNALCKLTIHFKEGNYKNKQYMSKLRSYCIVAFRTREYL